MNDEDLFNSRPCRWKVCTRCSGRGHIIDAYALAPGPRNGVRGAPESSIPATVVGSCSIFETCKEASGIALQTRRPVAFEFGDKVVVVRPDDDPEQVARAWWQDTYHKTPEESLACR